VEEGGYTVFLTWGLSVKPVKNSAILWFNFKPDGEEDETTEHSGCPVLKGTKWGT
jgi:prolyl 4-hydroxylase